MMSPNQSKGLQIIIGIHESIEGFMFSLLTLFCLGGLL